MFQARFDSTFLDVFRLPHEVSDEAFADALPPRHPLHGHGGVLVAASGAPRRLHWVRRGAADLGAPVAARLRGIPIFTPVLSDATAESWLRPLGAGWRAEEPVTDTAGRRLGSVWRAEDGSALLPFDPDDAVLVFWSESYRELTSPRLAAGAWDRALGLYYRARPLIPRRIQILLRRGLTRVQETQSFPAWPTETALHDLYDLLLRELARLARAPVPWIAFWPQGYDWAFVLTHDVETQTGLEHLEVLAASERERGLRSSWNLVPRRYEVPDEVVRRLQAEGFEIGVHGLYHDGFDIRPASKLRERLPAMHEWARRWGAVGFRAPATHRDWDSMAALGFDYDSSYSDSAPHEPQPGGCCTWLPFENRDVVELPITVPQDHTVFELLGNEDASLWLEKVDFLRTRGGLALLLTHPDYMLAGPGPAAYRTVLETFGAGSLAWTPLPRDVASWWRRRRASRLEPRHGSWEVVGPAADDAAVRVLEEVPAAA